MLTYVAVALALVVAPTAGCRKETSAPASAAQAKAVEVGVVTLVPEPVTLIKELPGRTSAFRVAEVRARVNGIVLKRLFTEGSDVKEGQALFKIDPAPYQATLESAQAQVARGVAAVEAAKLLRDRYAKLIESKAISQQEFDDARFRVKSAEADVAAARAAVKSAQINIGFTTVTAPLAGRIGRAEVTEGAYVQQSTATLLATVQQLDRLYVDLSWSSGDAVQWRRSMANGTAPGAANVTIVLEDGRPYDLPGTLQFADASVDPTTGMIALRATVPNPTGELLPGMFVRARIEEGRNPAAILVPQRAVSRDQGGR
ncbi:MAG: efflux RND transporter periplasmic adaptor subunit, partial [Deltaproteobacteria bacterium]|nr:efflux RND transporter periplasmic adaptor subunit [Deltaproteobacteria bacterium]